MGVGLVMGIGQTCFYNIGLDKGTPWLHVDMSAGSRQPETHELIFPTESTQHGSLEGVGGLKTNEAYHSKADALLIPEM